MAKKKTSNVDTLKENTIKMYDKTIAEMKERGVSEKEIAIVEKAKADAIASYDYVPTKEEVESAAKGIVAKNFPIDKTSTIYNVLGIEKNIEPLMDNLFIVHIGNLPIYLCQSVYDNSEKKTIGLSAIESIHFSPKTYFQTHRKFENMEIEYINALGKTIRVDRYNKVKVKRIENAYLSYESAGRPVTSYITFEYKTMHVSTTN